MAAYPKELEREVTLRDGARLRLRPIRPEDQDRLIAFYNHGPPEDPELIGVARYEPTDQADTAEIAFVIQDRWQNRGLGTLLLDALLAAAEARGIRRFRTYVLASNARMIDLLVRFTDVRERRMESGVTELLLARRPAVTGTGR